MPLFHKDGYNVSINAPFLNSIPHLQLTHDGLIPLVNTTFDYGRVSYVNSLMVTFITPLLLLLFLFAIYIVYILIIRTMVEDRFLIRATLVHKGEEPLQGKQKKKKDTYLKEKRGYGRCQGVYLFFGVAAIAGASYGTWLMCTGLNQSDNLLSEFIRVSTHSQQTIGNFSQQLLPKPTPVEYEYGDYLSSSGQSQAAALKAAAPLSSSSAAPPPPPPPTSAFQRWLPNTYQTIATYANYANASTANVRYFQRQFRYTSIAAVSVNFTSCFLLVLFWALFLAATLRRLDVKHFLLGTVLLLLLLTAIFSLNLTGSMALADFCLHAKPVITDITVYKIPSNNFTTEFVHYYLYCELNRLNLHQHTNTLTGFLDRFLESSLPFFNHSKVLQGVVSNVKSGIENTLETVHCKEINRLINEGLGQFCTSPVDGLTLTSVSFLFSTFLLIVCLFSVTFTL